MIWMSQIYESNEVIFSREKCAHIDLTVATTFLTAYGYYSFPLLREGKALVQFVGEK